jgi:histone H3/H4
MPKSKVAGKKVAKAPSRDPTQAIRADTRAVTLIALHDTVTMISQEAKQTMSDIALHIAKTIINKAISLASGQQKKKTISSDVIKSAALGILSLNIPVQILETWRNDLIANYDRITGILFKQLQAPANATMKFSINDAAKDHGVHYRPTALKRLLRQMLKAEMRIGEGVGVALAVCLSIYMTKLCSSINAVAVEPFEQKQMALNAKRAEGGREEKSPSLMLSAQHVMKGVEVDAVLRPLLKGLVVVGAPIGIVEIAGAIPKIRSQRMAPVVPSQKFGSRYDDEEEEEEDYSESEGSEGEPPAKRRR